MLLKKTIIFLVVFVLGAVFGVVLMFVVLKGNPSLFFRYAYPSMSQSPQHPGVFPNGNDPAASLAPAVRSFRGSVISFSGRELVVRIPSLTVPGNNSGGRTMDVLIDDKTQLFVLSRKGSQALQRADWSLLVAGEDVTVMSRTEVSPSPEKITAATVVLVSDRS